MGDGELMESLGGRRAQGWVPAITQVCTINALASSATIIGPNPPLELQFISGPREGEMVVLTDRLSTLGRANTNSVVVSDNRHTNVSRVHTLFELCNGRWYIQDNNS